VTFVTARVIAPRTSVLIGARRRLRQYSDSGRQVRRSILMSPS